MKIFGWVRPCLKVCFYLVLFSFLAACTSVDYARQAAVGQFKLLNKARPVEQLLADPSTPDDLRHKLLITREVKAFAVQHLDFKIDKQYDTYADLGRDAAVYTLLATPALSVEPKTWCYPLVGCLSYRGFFNEADAKALADQLRGDGYDVYWAGVDAYSTLGWFKDPLLNTFIMDKDILLAELLFHELSHSRVFAKGDTAFNESLAMAVQRVSVERWLRHRGSERYIAAYRARQADLTRFRALIRRSNKALSKAFASSKNINGKRQAKQRVYRQIFADYEALKPSLTQLSFDGFFYADDFNNAKLSAVGIYDQWVPAFLNLYQHLDGDMPRFWSLAKRLSQMSQPKREAWLKRWQPMN